MAIKLKAKLEGKLNLNDGKIYEVGTVSYEGSVYILLKAKIENGKVKML